jgi:hypothetical protein
LLSLAGHLGARHAQDVVEAACEAHMAQSERVFALAKEAVREKFHLGMSPRQSSCNHREGNNSDSRKCHGWIIDEKTDQLTYFLEDSKTLDVTKLSRKMGYTPSPASADSQIDSNCCTSSRHLW